MKNPTHAEVLTAIETLKAAGAEVHTKNRSILIYLVVPDEKD